MATTAQRCKRCGRTLITTPGSQYEICPVCHTVNHFYQKMKGRVLFRIGQFLNAATSRYHDDFQRQASMTSAAPHLSQFPHSRIHHQIPQVHGRKKAVLCGVTYNGYRKKLEASVHNVRSMQQLLVNKLGFPNSSILILTEEESETSRIPTKRNIQLALRWLIYDCQYGDSLIFYYSGHALQVPDEDGDEIDGYDEALCPLDYQVNGSILDDEINATIVAPLTHGVKLHSVIDSCFSGTVLDLPFLCKINRDGLYKWEEHCLTNKGTQGGKAVCIGACADNQSSADTSFGLPLNYSELVASGSGNTVTMAFTGKAIGALTFSFIQEIETDSNLTYGRLLTSLRKKIHQAQQVVGRFVPFATSKSQEPQLSSSTRFEIYSEPVMF